MDPDPIPSAAGLFTHPVLLAGARCKLRDHHLGYSEPARATASHPVSREIICMAATEYDQEEYGETT